jgi:hypothetical protein
MVIAMDDYRKSRAARRTTTPAPHDGELASRWGNVTQRVLTPELSDDVSTIEMKTFLERAGTLATQI